MFLAPLLAAPLPVQIHVFAALCLIPLTLAQFSLPLFRLEHGSRLHRRLGWSWIILMALVALSSFWIREIRLIGGFSPIHLLSVVTLVSLVAAVLAARYHRVHHHRRAMTWLTYGALMGTGVFTFLPGRLMNAVLFGL